MASYRSNHNEWPPIEIKVGDFFKSDDGLWYRATSDEWVLLDLAAYIHEGDGYWFYSRDHDDWVYTKLSRPQVAMFQYRYQDPTPNTGEPILKPMPWMCLGDLYLDHKGIWNACLETGWTPIDMSMPYIHPIDGTVWYYTHTMREWACATPGGPLQPRPKPAPQPDHYGDF